VFSDLLAAIIIALVIIGTFAVGGTFIKNMEHSYFNMSEEERACGFDCEYFRGKYEVSE